MNNKPIIALLLGDASGIAPEIVAKLLDENIIQDCCRPIIIGDNLVLEQGAKVAGVKLNYTIINDISETCWENTVPLLYQKHPELESVVVGKVNKQCGEACISMIETAVRLYKDGKISGICYAPLNKSALIEANCPAESEMEFFAYLLGVKKGFGEINMVDNVWTTRVTSHIPLKDVSRSLTVEKITDSIILADDTLKAAGYANPRIGVASLNPHAGENGKCGREEIEIIDVAIKKAVKIGINTTGPYPSDILFVNAFAGKLDAGVTMFHDQGQIALKLKGFERGITIGGGLGVPITTCAHGTGFDIVGKNIAGTNSLKNAIQMVSKMASEKE